jgi:hypothetical protein
VKRPGAEVRVTWACPKCGARAHKHGQGGKGACQEERHCSACEGFICECPDDAADDHGRTLKDPCPNANCYHCGWGGKFPTPKHLPKTATQSPKSATGAVGSRRRHNTNTCAKCKEIRRQSREAFAKIAEHIMQHSQEIEERRRK